MSLASAPVFHYSLSYPGNEDQVIDPASVYFDNRHDELFVADARNSRILIFDSHGRYTFDFRNQRHLAGARQLAVDSLGRIYVLRADSESVVSVFDYNGVHLKEMRFTHPGTDSALSIGGLLLDDGDRMYIVSLSPPHVYSFTTGGGPLSDFAVNPDDGDAGNQWMIGTPALAGNMLLIPLPMIPTVARYALDGRFIDNIGYGGGGAGELAFPIAVAGDSEGRIFILDKHRHTVIIFNSDGKFVRETGGKGISPGWLYHPTTLAVNNMQEAIVGQSFLGRVQAISVEESAP